MIGYPARVRFLEFSLLAFYKLLVTLLIGYIPILPVGANSFVSSEPISPLQEIKGLNQIEVQLGKALFHDKRLSFDNTVSCSSCHNIASGGDDGLPFSIGVLGKPGRINAPTVLNSGLNIAQFWDGRVKTLEEQVSEPIKNPVEMNSSWQQVIKKLTADKQMVKRFKRIYAEGITQATIAKAIANYERSLLTLNSPFDRYLLGDQTAINQAAKEGYQLFKSLGCAGCHQGKNVGGNMYQVFGVVGNYFEDRGNLKREDLGRYNVTGKDRDKFKFKVPSLRNVTETAPYFHDGSARTLEEAIKIMARYQLGRPIEANQVARLKDFLKTLSADVKGELK